MARKTPEKTSAKKVPGKKAPDKSAPKAVPPRDNIELLESVELTLTTEIGRTRTTIEAAHEWGEQSLVELEKGVGDPVDIRLNGELFAEGEVVTVGENFGVRITQMIEPPK